MMKAVLLNEFGSVDNFCIQNIPIPTPSDDEVLVKISAISINPIDVKTRIGKGAATIFTINPPVILGWDLSGFIVSCGANVKQWQNGDEVFGSINFPGLGKVNAEYATVTASHLARKPSSIPHEQCAAASMAGLTAWQAFTKYSQIKLNDKVLIHGASGGVGHLAVQIAKNFGAYVIGTSSKKNKNFVLSLGADEHISYDKELFEEKIRDVDFVFDTVGGDIIHRSLAVLKNGGTLVTTLPVENYLIEEFLKRNIKLHFILMNSCASDMENVAKLLEGKTISVHISHQFSLNELGKAHTILETGRTVGKIVLIC